MTTADEWAEQEATEQAEQQALEAMLDKVGLPDAYVMDRFRHLPPERKAAILRSVVKDDPHVGAGILFPRQKDDGERIQNTYEFHRQVEREQVADAMRLWRASQAKPLRPSELHLIAAELVLGSRERPGPTVGGLLYPGRVNAVYGTHTAGKTWLSLLMARLNAEAGGKTLVIDYEDSADGIADRCLAMGDGLEKSVLYVAPDGPVNAESLRRIIEREGVTLVVLDSVGESLAMGGYDSNAERDVTQWFTEVPDAIAALGPAVLIIDHIAKKQDGTPSPVGSFRKSAAITGAMFALENKVGFSRKQEGWSRITCTKDRNGYFATGEVVGRVDFRPGDGSMSVSFTPGDTTRMEITDRVERDVLAFVTDRMAEVHGKLDDNGDEMDGRPNITQIRAAVKGDNAKIKDAVDRLVLNGWLTPEHIKQGKTTRDVYVPGAGGLTRIVEDDDTDLI